jgi:hypothetical protein
MEDWRDCSVVRKKDASQEKQGGAGEDRVKLVGGMLAVVA